LAGIEIGTTILPRLTRLIGVVNPIQAHLSLILDGGSQDPKAAILARRRSAGSKILAFCRAQGQESQMGLYTQLRKENAEYGRRITDIKYALPEQFGIGCRLTRSIKKDGKVFRE